jgi:hypothetical protein
MAEVVLEGNVEKAAVSLQLSAVSSNFVGNE